MESKVERRLPSLTKLHAVYTRAAKGLSVSQVARTLNGLTRGVSWSGFASKSDLIGSMVSSTDLEKLTLHGVSTALIASRLRDVRNCLREVAQAESALQSAAINFGKFGAAYEGNLLTAAKAYTAAVDDLKAKCSG